MPSQAPLNLSFSIAQVANDWISFRKTGRYRITAQTSRLSFVDNSKDSESVFFPKSIPMRSNTIEIEILPADEDWANTQLKKAIDSLSRGAKTAGHFIDTQLEKETVAAARVLRFLETRDAALAMVRFFDSGPYVAMRLSLNLKKGLNLLKSRLRRTGWKRLHNCRLLATSDRLQD
jgi:hypothetical protein